MIKANYQQPEDILGDEGLLKQLTKWLMGRVLQAEMTHHLGYEPYAAAGPTAGTRATEAIPNG